MKPVFLMPETTIREAGKSAIVSLGEEAGTALLLTLGITRIVEQESLDLSVWGSADGADWGAKPLLAFPQKFYCGTYQILLDLTARPEVKHLQVRWQAQRWGKGDPKPLFNFYLFAQDVSGSLMAANA
jgi:hypothetical protein